MQGSLYALGALLKVEARSYLVSTDRRDIIAEDCKKEEEQHFEVRIRDLSQREINYFEKEVHQALCNFVDSLLEIKDIKFGIKLSTMSYHTEIIQEDFLEKYDEQNKTNHVELMRSEGSNFALLFLFDLLQFFYQFLSVTHQKPLDKDRFSFQDSKFGKLYNTLPAYLNHTFEYTVSDSVVLVRHVLKSIKAICPNPSHMLELWHLRRHVEVS
jgi:hypothetical protein